MLSSRDNHQASLQQWFSEDAPTANYNADQLNLTINVKFSAGRKQQIPLNRVTMGWSSGIWNDSVRLSTIRLSRVHCNLDHIYQIIRV